MRTVLFILLSLCLTRVSALPLLDRPYPLPADFDEVITIYPDHENTATKRFYWIVPSNARIFKNPVTNKLAFGLTHSGVSSFDPDGITVLLNVTMQPYIDPKALQNAKKLITEADAKDGAQSFFNFIVPKESTARLLVGGQPYDWNFEKRTAVAGGAVEAGFPFQIKVDKSIDVRALTQAGGDDASTFGVQFTMKYLGIGDRIHATVTANFKEVYKHFKAVVQASGWFGLVKGRASREWQTLRSSDLVKVTVHQGTQAQVDSILPKMIIDKLMTQLTERSGFFARQLKPSGLGNVEAPGGGGIWGWSVSGATAFESMDEERELKVEIDMQFTREQEIEFGMSFPSGGPELRSYVKNLTDTDKPYPTAEDFKKIKQQHQVCRSNNIKALNKLLANQSITKEQHAAWMKEAMEKGCIVDFTFSEDQMNLILKSDKELRPMIIEMLKVKHE